MVNSLDIIKGLIAEEGAIVDFIAPSVLSEYVMVKRRSVYKLKNSNPNLEGWGFFEKRGNTGQFLNNAAPFDVADYLQLLPSFSLILCAKLRGKTWLAYPEHIEPFKKRLGTDSPLLVHLVDEGTVFENIEACYDGSNFFYKGAANNLNKLDSSELFKLVNAYTEPKNLLLKYLTPEYVTAYTIVYNRMEDMSPTKVAERKLLEVAKKGGAKVRSYKDNGDYFVVDWTDVEGYNHTSTLDRNLKVISAGFCLSGQDAKFDFHSLMGITEKSPMWWRG